MSYAHPGTRAEPIFRDCAAWFDDCPGRAGTIIGSGITNMSRIAGLAANPFRANRHGCFARENAESDRS